MVESSERQLEAEYGDGFWSDHFTYLLDHAHTFLAIFPAKDRWLLWDRYVPFYFSPVSVSSRRRKYALLADGRPSQLNAVEWDGEKQSLIAARLSRGLSSSAAHLQRTVDELGGPMHVPVLTKFVLLASLKFATRDPFGMGLSMEAGKPGWLDALNGLPALFGSALPESCELLRLLRFLVKQLSVPSAPSVLVFAELASLLHDLDQGVDKLNAFYRSSPALANNIPLAAEEEAALFSLWDASHTALESYRERTRLSFLGQWETWSATELAKLLQRMSRLVVAGIVRARRLYGTGPLPPTYFEWTMTNFERTGDGCVRGLPCVRATRWAPRTLPLFLEGSVRLLKILPLLTASEDDEWTPATRTVARELYLEVRSSELFDIQLSMFKVNKDREICFKQFFCC